MDRLLEGKNQEDLRSWRLSTPKSTLDGRNGRFGDRNTQPAPTSAFPFGHSRACEQGFLRSPEPEGTSIMKQIRCVMLMLVALIPFVATLRGEEVAAKLLADGDVRPGLVVHLDCGDGELTAELGVQPKATIVQALSRSSVSVATATLLID